MRIALIDPPQQAFLGYYRFYFPLGLVSVGSMLEAQGHEVAIFDPEHLPEGRCLSNSEVSKLFSRYYESVHNLGHPIWTRLAERICRFRPEIVGITVLSCKVDSALVAARLVRDLLPGAKIMVGGDHTVFFAKDLAADPAIDAVVIGEGEETAHELVQAWSNGGQLGDVQGLAYRGDRGTVKTRRRPLIQNLDLLPLPNRSLLDDAGSYRPEDMGLIMTSRGCPERCTFCGIAASHGRAVRYRSTAICMEEIAQTKERYGTRYFSIRDATFTADRERAEEFCRALIATHPDIEWECLTRPDSLDEGLVSLMMEARCVQLRLGLESGSQRVLDRLQKRASVENYERTAAILNRLKIFWSAYVMVGTPDETLQDIRMTIELIERTQPGFVTLSRFVPLPGTPVYREIERQSRGIDWRRENNMCIDSGYTRHIPPDDFRALMEGLVEYAAEYNKHHGGDGSVMDRRMKDEEIGVGGRQ